MGSRRGRCCSVGVSQAALDTLRKEDIFARYGGEEFVVICREVDTKGAVQAAERLRERVARMRVTSGGHEISVTIGLGVASYPAVKVERPAELVAAADEVLYQAKRSGGNRVVARPDGR